MTISKAIEEADSIRSNEIDAELKAAWLMAIDNQIANQLCLYDEDAATNRDPYSLSIPAPYDELYVHYLVMRIYLEEAELVKYNCAARVFERSYQTYASQRAREIVGEAEGR